MRNLEFVSPTEGAFLNAIAGTIQAGAERLAFPVVNALAQAVTRQINARFPGVNIDVGDDADGAANPASVVVVCETDGERMTEVLMRYVDRPHVTVIAAITNHYWNRRPVFLISIPKAGTHLIIELLGAFGYRGGGECQPHARAGFWHFLEFTNSHTQATDFFGDTVRRAPLGNLLHPFAYHPSVFIYRNPLDIVASETVYYSEFDSSPHASYLGMLTDKERLLRLIDDPWLLGSIRDRVRRFAAWLDFGCVLPVSYEELVGAEGGGSEAAQHDLVWSLMLRLHVPGRPADFAAQVFNPEAATFRSGQIGGHERRFTAAAWEKFRALPQDFMQVFGYSERPAHGPWLPDRRDEFRRRVPRYSKGDPGKTAFIVRTEFLGKKIVRYRDAYWAIPPTADITAAALDAATGEGLAAGDLDTIEFLVHTKLFLEFLRKGTAANSHLTSPQVATALEPLLEGKLPVRT